MAIDPACSADYLRKRFAERIWDSEIEALLRMIPEAAADEMVTRLVEGLLVECGAV
ncbi:hypothetical protein [Streptomyces fumanus]|uniref:hypothetical protein n=1 Tax=Streptomyces fumanus TaxID=67302 RepID=UPI0033D0AC3B